MDPEKTLTFCLGLKADEMTMSFQGLYGITTTTVAVSMVDTETPTGDVEVGMEHEGSGSQPVVSPKYCPGVNNNPGYLCETGHCCGETGCCTYYYELWWFWLLWTVLILFSCFCAYRHRRAKLRIQQQQRQREINLIAYNGACNYPSSTLDLSFLASFKLPSYEEVAAQPSTPPPPYSSIFALECGAMGDPSPPYHHHHHCPPCPPYLGPGPSGLTSSQSSDNNTSCSCESCSITSPSSTSFSVQVTDETFNSSHVSTPSDAGVDCAVLPRLGATFTPTPCTAPPSLVPPDVIPVAAPDVIPVQRRSSNSGEALSPLAPPLLLPLHSRPSHPARLPLSPLMLLSALPPGQVHPFIPSETLGVRVFQKDEAPGRGPAHRLTPSLPKLALFPSNASVLVNCNSKEEQKREREVEEEEEEDDEEDHFRHRRLTGDSGIVVCRCHVKRQEQEKDELHAKGEQRADSADCSLSAKAAVQPPVLGQYAEQRGHFPSSSAVIQNMREAIITMESS